MKGKNINYGIKAENFFSSILNKIGIENDFVDEWYDFLVNKNIKVEVKSTCISISEGKKGYKCGRFDFTKLENRKKQFKENIWIALILRNEKEFMLIGFVRARELNKKRYLSLPQIRTIKLINLENWLKIVNK